MQTRQTRKTESNLTIARTLPHLPCRLDKVCRLFRKQRRGASAVEFAIVAPVFFLLVFGMIEYGRMVMVQQVLTNAAREGARRAVLDGATTNDVETVVLDYLASSTINGGTVTVNPDPPGSAESGDPISVEVSIPFESVSWLPSPMFLGGRTMTAAAVMRRESVQ